MTSDLRGIVAPRGYGWSHRKLAAAGGALFDALPGG